MRADVEDYVRHCDACQVNKASTKAYAEKLQPLSIPGRRWAHINMDLIVKLPETDRGHDSILVFVDRLSEMVHIIPTVESGCTSSRRVYVCVCVCVCVCASNVRTGGPRLASVLLFST
jgi:hypothetical protein